jgi:hypothetical protein
LEAGKADRLLERGHAATDARPIRTSAYRYAATTPSIHDAFPPLCIQFCAYWHYYLFYAEMQDLSRCAGAISAGLEILDKAFADSAEKSV